VAAAARPAPADAPAGRTAARTRGLHGGFDYLLRSVEPMTLGEASSYRMR